MMIFEYTHKEVKIIDSLENWLHTVGAETMFEKLREGTLSMKLNDGNYDMRKNNGDNINTK